MNPSYGQSSTGSGFDNKRALVGVCGPFLLLLGTGGHWDVHALRQYPAQYFTTPAPEITGSSSPEATPTPTAQSLAERVSEIKAAFGLTISQLAQVLQVQRQTIYDWIDEDNPPQVQGKKGERLAAIQRLAVQWNALCQWPAGKGVATYSVDGDTLLDVLSADVLDEARLQRVMRGLSEQVKAEWQRKEECSFGEQARRRGFQPHGQSLRSVLAGYGGAVSLTHDDE